MNVRRETPSVLELCHRHNKRKDREVTSSLKDCLESKKCPVVRRLCSGQSCPAEACKSNVSPETRQRLFPFIVGNRNEPRLSTVETRSSLVFCDSFDSDTESSSEEDCDTLAGPFQVQNGYVWANNLQTARFYDELERQRQREVPESSRKIMHRILENPKSFPLRVVGEQRQGYLQNQAKTQGYLHSQTNRQSRSRYHYDPFRHAANSLEYPLPLRANASRRYSRHCQDLDNHLEWRQTCRRTSNPYVYMQRNEANWPQGSHTVELNKRETKLPPIQPLNDRARGTKTLPLQFRRSKQRRQGRQEDCEARNQREERRKGVCPVTDSAREQRTFARVLGKRF